MPIRRSRIGTNADAAELEAGTIFSPRTGTGSVSVRIMLAAAIGYNSLFRAIFELFAGKFL